LQFGTYRYRSLTVNKKLHDECKNDGVPEKPVLEGIYEIFKKLAF